jgi:hypothetical protein
MPLLNGSSPVQEDAGHSGQLGDFVVSSNPAKL